MLADRKTSFFNNAPEKCGHFSPGTACRIFSLNSAGSAVIACPVADRGLPGWQAVRQKSIAEIFEIGGDTEVTAPHKLDYRLQIVFLFSGDANLSILQLALHFEPL